jgi:hypothetical protein
MKQKGLKRDNPKEKINSFDTIFTHFYFFSSVLLLLSPLIGFIINNLYGFLGGLLITFFTVHYWAGIFKEKNNIKDYEQKNFIKNIILIFNYL